MKDNIKFSETGEVLDPLLRFIFKHGSELLKMRYEGGYHYESLAKMEYAKYLLNSDVIASDDDDFDGAYEEDLCEPSIEIMKKVNKYKTCDKYTKLHLYYCGEFYLNIQINDCLGLGKQDVVILIK